MPKRQDWSNAAYQVFWDSRDLLFPPGCAGCGKLGAKWQGNPLAMQLGQKYPPKSLLRVNLTHSQVGLAREERIKNVRGAFAAMRTIVAGRSILLMDVVFTTGATMVSASEAFKAAGAEKV